jgi:chain length determinant protein (polysaccharide antigen chain regulator)
MEAQRVLRPAAFSSQPVTCPYHSSMPTAPLDDEDDLSLAGLWHVMMLRWKVIVSTMILAVAAAAVYLFTAAPQYAAQVVIMPPEAHHIEALNIPDINSTSAEQVYTVFVRNLKSHALRRQFFHENGLASALGADCSAADELAFQQEFSNLLTVKEGSRDQKDLVFVTLEGDDPAPIAERLNEFVHFAATTTIEDIVGGVRRRIELQREKLNEQIEIARIRAKQQREDHIANLEERLTVIRDGRRRQDRLALLDEHIAIARELDIINRDAPYWMSDGPSVALSISTASELLYLRGVTELVAEREAIANRKEDDPFLPGVREILAEIEVLKARTNDDPFITDLRPKEEQLAQLEASLAQLHVSAAGAVPARIDRPATTPNAPDSPKKTRILPLSLVAGLLLGVFAAFQVNALDQRRS